MDNKKYILGWPLVHRPPMLYAELRPLVARSRCRSPEFRIQVYTLDLTEPTL